MRLFLLFMAIFYCFSSSFAQGIDSTKRGIGKAKVGMFFKRYFDFRNNGSGKKYRRDEEKSNVRLAFPFESDGYELVFRDEFDSLNLNIWQTGQPWGRFHGQFPHQYYGDSEVFINNGVLCLQNRLAPRYFQVGDTTIEFKYGTGMVNSYSSNNFMYGYFSIRSKNPTGPATWPAFWLTGKNNWPPEIDIFEMYGRCDGEDIHEQTMTVHFGKIETQTKTSLTKSVDLSADTDSTFHIYSCLWEPGKMSFYTDGVLLKVITLNSWMEQFYREPMYIIINNAVDHRYLDCMNPRLLPCTFEVDWVRVYQKKT